MTRLLVLWLLAERASTGYEIARTLRDGGLRTWFSVEDPSIYAVLRTLVRNGYATETVENPDSGRPRTRYALTASGRSLYRELLREAIAMPATFAAPVELALAAGGDLDEAEVDAALAERVQALERLSTVIERDAAAAPAAAIVNRRRALVASELEWARGVLNAETTT